MLHVNPLYSADVSVFCPTHGEYFIHKIGPDETVLAFRPFDSSKIFRLEKNEKKEPRKRKPRKPRAKKPRNPVGNPGRPIYCNQTGQAFPSIRMASIVMGLDKGCIYGHLNGRRTHVGGYTFSRMDVYNPEDFESKPLEPMVKRAMTIKCNETGEVFLSTIKAGKKLGVLPSNIYYHLKGSSRHSHVGGYTFSKIDDGRKTSQELQGLV